MSKWEVEETELVKRLRWYVVKAETPEDAKRIVESDVNSDAIENVAEDDEVQSRSITRTVPFEEFE